MSPSGPVESKLGALELFTPTASAGLVGPSLSQMRVYYQFIFCFFILWEETKQQDPNFIYFWVCLLWIDVLIFLIWKPDAIDSSCVCVRARVCLCTFLYIHCGHDLWYKRIGLEVRKLGPAWDTSLFLDLLYSGCCSIEDTGFLTCKMRSSVISVVINLGCPLETPGAQTLPGRLESDSLRSGAWASACFLCFLSSFFELLEVTLICS